MKILIRVTLLFLTLIPLLNASEWLYYKNYPWVYDHKTKGWFYLSVGTNSEIYAYRYSTKEWATFDEILINASSEKTWDEKYQEWLKKPDPYGGIETLELIKNAKQDNNSYIDLSGKGISDIAPLEGLINFVSASMK